MAPISRRLVEQQEGASAIIVALSMVALVGAVALAVDGGQMMAERRNVTVDTDAAALGTTLRITDRVSGGQTCADASAAASSDATQILADNDPDTVLAAPPDVVCSGAYVRTEVSATKRQDFIFARIFPGIADGIDIPSSSTAESGPTVGLGGEVLPLAICANTSGHYDEWTPGGWVVGDEPIYGEMDPGGRVIHPTGFGVGAGAEYQTNGIMVHRIYFAKHVLDTNPGCDPLGLGGSGNWGWMDFDPPGGGANELKDRIENGYEGPVIVDGQPWSLGTPTGADCDPTTPGEEDCGAETGANASTKNALDGLKCPVSMAADDCIVRWVIVFDVGYGGPGSGLLYHPIDFIPVVLRDFEKVTGNAGPGDEPYFDFEFLFRNAEGRIGRDADPVTTKSRTLQQCGADAFSTCQP